MADDDAPEVEETKDRQGREQAAALDKMTDAVRVHPTRLHSPVPCARARRLSVLDATTCLPPPPERGGCLF